MLVRVVNGNGQRTRTLNFANVSVVDRERPVRPASPGSHVDGRTGDDRPICTGMADVVVRDLQWPADHAAVARLDTSFTTDVIYGVRRTAMGFELETRSVSPPLTKAFEIEDLDSDDRPWDRAFVAVLDGEVSGFAAVGFESWNKRLTLWHLYVQPGARRRGLGRALVDHAVDEARKRQAVRLWLETTNLNYPAVQAYQRLGLELCGMDTTLYDATRADGEIALFMSRRIPQP